MSNENYIKNEALVKAMLKNESRESDTTPACNPYNMAYLISFVAGAMEEIPDLHKRVEQRILMQIKLDAIAENAVSKKS